MANRRYLEDALLSVSKKRVRQRLEYRLSWVPGWLRPKRKRQTKHRGNAAGVVEARGRTGRPPSAEEKKRSSATSGATDRLNRKPTWKSSVPARAPRRRLHVRLPPVPRSEDQGRQPRRSSAVIYAIVATLLYILLGYYMETFLWRRRMAKKQAARRER